MNVGELRAAIAELPDEMPVVAPIGCEGSDLTVDGVEVGRLALMTKNASCTEWGRKEGRGGVYRETCCGGRAHGPVRDVLLVGGVSWG